MPLNLDTAPGIEGTQNIQARVVNCVAQFFVRQRHFKFRRLAFQNRTYIIRVPDIVQRENQCAFRLEIIGDFFYQRDEFFIAQRADKRTLNQNRVERHFGFGQLRRDNVTAIRLNRQEIFLRRLEIFGRIAD